jgi:hypothetical protein
LTATQINSIATNYLRLGQSPDDVQKAIAAVFKYGSGTGLTGVAAVSQADLQQYYDDYQVPVSPQKLQQQVQQLLSGVATPEGIKAAISQQAQTLRASNPQLVDYLKQGHTVRDWADPFMQHGATLLGLNPHSMDLNAPMWNTVLNPATDPATGKPTGQALSIDQWDQMLRNDPKYGFDTSANGKQSASQLIMGLKQTMGFQ